MQVHYLIAGGGVDDAVAFLKSRDQVSDATLVSQAAWEGLLPSKRSDAVASGSDESKFDADSSIDASLRPRSTGGTIGRVKDVSPDVIAIITARAEAYQREGRPILAACCHLSVRALFQHKHCIRVVLNASYSSLVMLSQVDNGDAAVTALLRGGERVLAYIVAQLASVDNVDVAAKRLAEMCESVGLVDEAIRLLQELKDGRKQVMDDWL